MNRRAMAGLMLTDIRGCRVHRERFSVGRNRIGRCRGISGHHPANSFPTTREERTTYRLILQICQAVSTYGALLQNIRVSVTDYGWHQFENVFSPPASKFGKPTIAMDQALAAPNNSP